MPTVNACEEDREAVLTDLARGRFDYLEVASRVTEANFFRYQGPQPPPRRAGESLRPLPTV